MATFYLSSTFLDLRECREKVSDTLRQMGHTVIGMEDYAADARPPLEKVLADIGECDVYLGIFAWRYGYIPKKNNPLKQAITELEYREAIRLKKEPLIFILRNDAPWPGQHQPQDDKERKQIHALRDELSQAHSPARFRDSDDLATKVSVAVSRFLANREIKSTPPSSEIEDRPVAPPINQVQKPIWWAQFLRSMWRWKWYAFATVALAGLATALLYKPSVTFLPPPYPNEKKYQFLISERSAVPEIWNLQPGKWDLERGEGEDENVGALLIKGNQMATPKDLGGRAFYNYQADFKVRFKVGDKAAWVLRAQPDGQSGYLFEVRKNAGSLFINGWILKNNRTVGDPLPGGRMLRYSLCCKPTDAIHIVVDVTDNMVDGTHIKYQIAIESDYGHTTEDTFKTDDTEFIDSERTFAWGTIGLLVTDGITLPETADGVMRVEYLNLNPLRTNKAT